MSPRWGSGNVPHVSFYKDLTPLGFQDCIDISRFFFTKSVSILKVFPRKFLLIPNGSIGFFLGKTYSILAR
jgi:hypothetical protein